MLTETRLQGKGEKHASSKFYKKKIGAKGREVREQKFLDAITPFINAGIGFNFLIILFSVMTHICEIKLAQGAVICDF